MAVLLVMPLFFCSNIIFGRAIAGQVEPFTLAFIRWSLTAVILMPFVWPQINETRHMIASFSRGLLQDLRADQSDEEFDAALGRAIDMIAEASVG